MSKRLSLVFFLENSADFTPPISEQDKGVGRKGTANSMADPQDRPVHRTATPFGRTRIYINIFARLTGLQQEIQDFPTAMGYFLVKVLPTREKENYLSDKTFTGLYCEEALLSEIKINLERGNCRTRNEFINKAIRFYISYLETANNSSTLFPILDEALDGRMLDTENRLSRVLFKQGVEIAMMMHIVAATNEIDVTQLAALRSLCREEVARLSGRYSFEDAVRFQNS